MTGPDGPVSDGSPRLDGTTVHQPLLGGPAGRYSVAWRATSADGHPVSGTFAFTAQAASPPSSTTTPATTTTSTPTSSSTSASASTTSSPTSVTAAPTATSTTSVPWLAVVIVIIVAALAVGGWALYRRRNPAGPGAT
ncbi:MAG TPA: copper resistance CopC family protein [Lapillicoccus sp.]|nr:copper resistance CopC family protein [Lapillicoccus sp.]